MVAYAIAEQIVHDPATFDEYRKQVAPLIERFGGKYLNNGVTRVLDGKAWQPERVIIIEFPDKAALDGWYNSPEYQPMKKLRDACATVMVIALEGR